MKYIFCYYILIIFCFGCDNSKKITPTINKNISSISTKEYELILGTELSSDSIHNRIFLDLEFGFSQAQINKKLKELTNLKKIQWDKTDKKYIYNIKELFPNIDSKYVFIIPEYYENNLYKLILDFSFEDKRKLIDKKKKTQESLKKDKGNYSGGNTLYIPFDKPYKMEDEIYGKEIEPKLYQMFYKLIELYKLKYPQKNWYILTNEEKDNTKNNWVKQIDGNREIVIQKEYLDLKVIYVNKPVENLIKDRARQNVEDKLNKIENDI